MATRKILVVPRENQWAVELDGKLYGSLHPSRGKAVDAARHLASTTDDAQILVQAGDGEMVRVDNGSSPLAGEEGFASYW